MIITLDHKGRQYRITGDITPDGFIEVYPVAQDTKEWTSKIIYPIRVRVSESGDLSTTRDIYPAIDKYLEEHDKDK